MTLAENSIACSHLEMRAVETLGNLLEERNHDLGKLSGLQQRQKGQQSQGSDILTAMQPCFKASMNNSVCPPESFLGFPLALPGTAPPSGCWSGART